MLTPHHVDEWTEAAHRRLDDLAGFILWEEDYPIPIRFCDGHAVHQGDARDLRDQLMTMSAALGQRRQQGPGEDGDLVDLDRLFISLYGCIANAERVRETDPHSAAR
ncbi:MAG: hypothetical protein DPW09_39055 [Anaerolineae bacterium]|nr:hypothetical protein [Anaerolineales bacterium]MCQ3979455.1 hypothetical protein [Anaerolineae bacterium]